MDRAEREAPVSLWFSLDGEESFSINITHNLTQMADVIGVYEALWHPERIKATKAKDITARVENALLRLRKAPRRYGKFADPAGWGTVPQFRKVLEEILVACEKDPEAVITAHG